MSFLFDPPFHYSYTLKNLDYHTILNDKMLYLIEGKHVKGSTIKKIHEEVKGYSKAFDWHIIKGLYKIQRPLIGILLMLI